mmetsp:Transcript_53423/g.141662  ORF Transcript_53423/g.141662 Transcript_53423/m.141662 type:complete len:122 (-) Transcript_53423:736-1101(-)
MHILLGVVMVMSVGAASFVYISVTVVFALALVASSAVELWGRIGPSCVANPANSCASSSPLSMSFDQVQSYVIVFFIVVSTVTYALVDTRRQQRERFRRLYMQDRLRAEREERRRRRAKAE